MHKDQIRDLAREFQGELLSCGVEEHILSRMIERAISYAVECGTHMPLQEIWLAAGGNPGLTPDKEAVVDALKSIDEAVDDCDANHKAIDASVIEQAVLRIPTGYFDNTRRNQEANRASVAKMAAREFTPLQSSEPTGTPEQPRSAAIVTRPVPSVSNDLINAILAYGDSRADNTSDSANKIGDVIQLIRNSYNDLINPKKKRDEPKQDIKLKAFVAKFDGDRSVSAAKHDGAIHLRFVKGELKTELSISEKASMALITVLIETTFPGLIKKPYEQQVIAGSPLYWSLLGIAKGENGNMVFSPRYCETVEPVDSDPAVISAYQKAQWINRYAEHCVSKGVDAKFARESAEASYDPQQWKGVTPEDAADTDISQWADGAGGQ